MGKAIPFVEFLLNDAMRHIDGLRVRPMFGAHGFYQNGIFFALTSDDELYFKVDDENRIEYKKAGSRPFTYMRKKKEMKLSYWTVPAEVLEDPRELVKWVEKAVAAGLRAKEKKKPKKNRAT